MEIGYVVRDAKQKGEVDTERDASESDAGYEGSF